MITVLYNGSCPICSKEIGHYQKTCADIQYEDLNQTDLTTWAVDKETAMRRLHVRAYGRVFTGVDAFLQIWMNIPRYRRLATFVSLPGVYGLASALYDRVLSPLLYRLNHG